MTVRPSSIVLFLGDLCFFILSLYLALYFRALDFPPKYLLEAHLFAFAPLFLVWVLVYLIAGLYDWRQFLLARRALSSTLLSAQIANVIIAALFFFLIPTFGISPKTVLLIYLGISFGLILLWRAFLFPVLGIQKSKRALFIGQGREIEELVSALKISRFAPITIVEVLRSENATISLVEEAIRVHKPEVVVADFADPKVASSFPELYKLFTSPIRFMDTGRLYEEVFGRIPLSRLDDRWIAENISRSANRLYDPLKRLMDILAGMILGLISLVFYPFVILAVALDDGRPFFITQERSGEGDKKIRLIKFRSMSGNDSGNYENGATKLSVTKVGKFLRVTRLDELPQLWNIFIGDLSLIGPRPELPSLVAQYEREIPYYSVRHLIKPGLSGWAQLYHENHPHHGTNVEATREKLSFDLYYLKHRSLTLDIIIALKTIKKMLQKSGV